MGNATEQLLGAKRLTNAAIGRYVEEALTERAGIRVKILGVENVSGPWLPARDGSADTIRTYWVEVSCDYELRRKIVGVVRNPQGLIASVNLY